MLHFHQDALRILLRNPFHQPQCDRITSTRVKSFISLSQKGLMKRSYFSRKPLETESLSEVQFVNDNCCFVSESNYFNKPNKVFSLHNLACFIREQMQAGATLLVLKITVGLQILAKRVGKVLDFNHKTNIKEALTLLSRCRGKYSAMPPCFFSFAFFKAEHSEAS